MKIALLFKNILYILVHFVLEFFGPYGVKRASII